MKLSFIVYLLKIFFTTVFISPLLSVVFFQNTELGSSALHLFITCFFGLVFAAPGLVIFGIAAHLFMHLKKPMYKLVLSITGILIVFLSIQVLSRDLKELAVNGMHLQITYPLVILFSVIYYDPGTEKMLDAD